MLLSDRILSIDAEAMVLDKPAGVPVDAPRDGTLAVVNHLDSLRFGFERQPMIVHRLDRDTSGCLILARNPRSQKKLQQAFEAGKVEKYYLAVLDGVPAQPDGTIDIALNKVSSREGGWRIVPVKDGQRAVTHWETVSFGEGRTLICLRPETGRTHQLRVHAANGIGIPIVGDTVYGRGGSHMLLHATSISVPREGKAPIAASAPLPDHFPEWARRAIA
jgi:tRNA pseudouridine32 synthase / 23S rRNA pseudouridine746 synthase